MESLVRRIFAPPDANSNLEHSFDRDVRDKLNSDIRLGATGFELNPQDDVISDPTSISDIKYKWGNYSENLNGQFIALQYADTFTGRRGIDIPHDLKRTPQSFFVLDNSILKKADKSIMDVTSALVAPQPYGKPSLPGFWDETNFRVSLINPAMTGLDADQLFRLTLFLF